MKNCFSVLLLLLGISVFYTAARPPSLANRGNTCYFNSILQNLYNFEPITRELITRKTPPETKFIEQYVPLIKRFRAGETDGFGDELEKLNKTITDLGVEIRPGQQEDTTEAFGYIVNFTDKNGKIQTIPVFWNSMGFMSARKNIYYGTEKVIEIGKDESELNLIPEYPHDSTIVDQKLLLKTAFALEESEAANVYAQTGQVMVGQCPEILMVWVKVFKAEYDKKTNSMVSSRIQTNFDGESFLKPLDLKDYVVADSKGFKDQDTVYNLIGVACQSGGLGGGHYIALIKDQYDPERSWYYCSDSTVYALDKKQVAEQIKTTGYVFFYRKKSAEDASITQQIVERLAQALKLLAEK